MIRRGAVPLTGGTIVLALIAAVVTGQNPLVILGQMAGEPTGGSYTQEPAGPPGDDPSAVFTSKVLATTEDTWNRLMPGYREPRLVLFRDGVDSACGFADKAVGPFYCPGDQRLYLDLTFFDELSRQFGAPGDFAAAYVVAHEVGHHVQTLTGTSDQVRRSGDRAGAGSAAVRLELQADCYAGVWAHDAQRRGLLEVGDVEEAMRAAQAIGDDTLQKRGRGHVNPDSFTHGTSAQRAKWFRTGLETGKPESCDTFQTRRL